jgi:putative addiction module killer protein
MEMNIQVKEYINEKGVSVFQQWFNKLDAQTAARISTALYRLEAGNDSHLKSLAGGVYECKLNFWLGYRIYMGKEGPAMIILLCGGSKNQQNKDIALARELWQAYKL